MSIWMLVLGLLLLGVASYDIAVTTISTTSASGPLTGWISSRWWHLAHRFARRPRSLLLTSAGPLVLVGTVFVWLLLLWAGWTLVFAAEPSAVVAELSGEPADWWSRVYFAGFTTFTLGVGDYAPAGAPWQVLTVVATISGLAITTASITYLIPVVTAATDRSRLAGRISVLGNSAHEMVINAHLEGSVQYLERLIVSLTDDVLLTAERHVAYPILHYFHPGSARTELRVQLTALDDALTLVEHGLATEVGRPHPAAGRALRAAITHLLERANVRTERDPAQLDLEPLRRAGLATVTDAAFARALDDLDAHRRRMAGYAAESQWDRETGRVTA